MRRLLVFFLALLAARVEAGGSAPADVEAALRRLWDRPGLLLDAGLNKPATGEAPFVLRALEFTAKSAKLSSVEWTPGKPGRAGAVRGDLKARIAGVMPPSTRTLDLTVEAPGVSLDRRALETRGSVRLVDPGSFRATSRIPLDLLEALNRPTRISEKAGGLLIQGRRRVLLFEVPFRLQGPLACEDRVHVFLRPTQLSLASIQAPGPIRDALLDAVNPVLCIDAAMGPLRHLMTVEIESVQVEPGAIVLKVSGRLRPPGDPDAGPPHHPPRKPKPSGS
ncbi:MAG: LmeA family phospholipid-binding protein [Candidatus Wallbacteria bacterium]|nr:LmeA family phospholipid-binding protein [Candidatus Wallbacteria bacterium]